MYLTDCSVYMLILLCVLCICVMCLNARRGSGVVICSCLLVPVSGCEKEGLGAHCPLTVYLFCDLDRLRLYGRYT